MSQYKKILSGYVNDSKQGDGKYLAITNHTDEDIVIEAGGKLFMNMTPKETRDQYPKVPVFSKSVKIEESDTVRVGSKEYHETIASASKVEDEIPF